MRRTGTVACRSVFALTAARAGEGTREPRPDDEHAVRRRGTCRAARARLGAGACFGVEERRRRVPGPLSFCARGSSLR